MNTPDQTPKDGDFVAYVAELERRQAQSMRTSGATAPTPGSGAPPPPGPAAKPDAAAVAKAVPLALAVTGLVLLVIGFVSDGGIFPILIGAFLLWQAVRVAVRSTPAASAGASQAAQRVAALLSAHAQRKRPPPR
jgi:hypothetical protein